jgi:hypothetical protein
MEYPSGILRPLLGQLSKPWMHAGSNRYVEKAEPPANSRIKHVSGTAMSEQRGEFDWLAVSVRLAVIALLATLLLTEGLQKHDRTGAVLVVGIGYVILPAIAYLHTRHDNLKCMVGVVEAVRRKFGTTKAFMTR